MSILTELGPGDPYVGSFTRANSFCNLHSAFSNSANPFRINLTVKDHEAEAFGYFQKVDQVRSSVRNFVVNARMLFGVPFFFVVNA